MRMQTIESSGTSRYIKSFLFGQLFGVIALFVSYILFAIVVTAIDLPPFVLTLMTIIGLGIAGLICGYFSAKAIGNKGLVIGFISGLMMSLLFLLLSVLLFSCKWNWRLGIKLIVIGICAIFGGIFGVNSKKRHR